MQPPILSVPSDSVSENILSFHHSDPWAGHGCRLGVVQKHRFCDITPTCVSCHKYLSPLGLGLPIW